MLLTSPGRRLSAVLLAGALLLAACSPVRAPGLDEPAPTPTPTLAPPVATPGPDAEPRLALSFAAEPFELVPLAWEQLPYVTGAVTPIEPQPPVDAEGVRQFEAPDGELYDHPVHLAQEGLRLLDSHHAGAGQEYFDLSVRHAERLLSIGHRARDALYFPYSFDAVLFNDPNDLMIAPWYSAMAQGQALSLLVRLHELTGESRYREAADDAFATFLNLRDSDDEPWTVFVDDNGYLWLEEYPKEDPAMVLNGQLFAAFGLYEYHQLTGDADALELFRGGITTVQRYFEDFRDPGSESVYCLRRPVVNAKYHAIHIRQLDMLAAMTGDAEWQRLAEVLVEDAAPIEILDREV